MQRHILKYNHEKWVERTSTPKNTLQLFITNRCNLRCKGCFYEHKLGKQEMSLDEYKSYVNQHFLKIDKLIILGGEPTLHSSLGEMVEFNNNLNLQTTIYTNGYDLNRLEKTDLSNTCIRLGVYGSFSSEKSISKVKRTNLSIDLVYMLRKDNVSELFETADIAEREFNCKGIYLSSIRDITATGSFWKDTEETLPLEEYASVVQDFVDNYSGNIPKIHISRRTVLYTENTDDSVKKCRMGNIFPDGEKIICPFDISRKITSPQLVFNQRDCNKNDSCILRKIVLERK